MRADAGRALNVLVDMLRNSNVRTEEIEREKGVIVEEMNLYFDTPRDYVEGVYHRLLVRRHAATTGTSSAARNRTSATRETFLGTSTGGTRSRDGRRIARNFDKGIRQEVEEMLGGVESAIQAVPTGSGLERRRAGRPDPLEDPDQAHVAIGVRADP